MLDPHDRVLFSEALRPPDGYQLSWAIGTSYTLDLVAAMAAPLAFALFDCEQQDASPAGADAIPLLEALRRYAGRLTVFVQAGQIAVPKPQQFLLSYLENSVIEATAPARGGLFHPKIWLLRFAAEDAPVRYRFACLSRNLTFDRAWDTAVVIEGMVADRQRAFAVNHPLADFIAALPGLALRPVSPEIAERARQGHDEVLRVAWELPAGFDGLTFWPLGIRGHRRWPLAGRADRRLVVSPFLSQAALVRLGGSGDGDILVSRLESLQELENLGSFHSAYVLDEAASIDDDRDDANPADHVLQGPHAKLYVADAGWQARVWTGSANATDAAFGPNVEFLVELQGPRSKFGIDALLAKGAGEARFSDLLQPYSQHQHLPPDEVEEGLRARIERARQALARAAIVARVQADGAADQFTVTLTSEHGLAGITDDISVRCWPVMLGETASECLSVSGPVLARFAVTGEELSSLFAFAVKATKGTRTKEERFTLNLPLEGAPEGRHDRVLRAVLRDRNRVLRFLLFLLADGDPRQAAGLLAPRRQPGDGNGAGEHPLFLDIPLLESLLRALDREPEKLDHVAALVSDLRKAPDGQDLIPEGFADVWEPVWAARQARP